MFSSRRYEWYFYEIYLDIKSAQKNNECRKIVFGIDVLVWCHEDAMLTCFCPFTCAQIAL